MKEKIINIGVPLAFILAVIGIIFAAVIRHNSTEQDQAVAVTVPVTLTAEGEAKQASLGLIVTIGNENAEGSEWKDAASGAKVALERFNRSGARISLLTEDDRGTAEGAVQAVESLAQQKVSGIILASQGQHLEPALRKAEELGIPLILPYAESAHSAWSLKPSEESLTQLVVSHNNFAHKVIRIDQQDFPGLDIPAEENITINSTTDFNKLTEEISQLTAKVGDSATIFLNTDSYMQARIASALHESGNRAQILLGYEATSPAFSQAFMKDKNSAVLNALSIGYKTDDSVALQTDGQGRSMSAYLQMVKILAESPDATNALGDQKFSEIALAADSRSHDATVALIRAIEKAGSTDPKAVKKAMPRLELAASDGITGPSLNFSQPYAVTTDPLLLSPTVGDINLRITEDSSYTPIIWVNTAE